MSLSDNEKFRDNTIRGQFYDYNLLAVVILLMAFGLVMLYSASSYESMSKFGNDMYFFFHQGVVSVLAVLVAIVVSRINYHYLLKIAFPLYVLSIILMAMVKFTPLGVDAYGSKRWLNLGIKFQPSEMAKITVVLLLVYEITRMGREFRTFAGIVRLSLVGIIAAGAAFFFTDNLSTALIILGISIGVMFVAHPKTKEFLIFFAIAAALVVVFIIYLRMHITDSDDFRIRRILVWMDPEKYADIGGWQVLQGLYAIGSGGLLGKGLGASTQKLDIIPEAQNDMIFSIICEELGLFGAILLLVLFGYLLYRLFNIAQNAPDMQGTMIVTGIFTHIALQVILNIAVVLNLIPTTGISLPWVSYGGTSVGFLMIEIGIALSVSRSITAYDLPAPKKRTVRHTVKNGQIREVEVKRKKQ